MTSDLIIAPSVLASDFSKLGEEIKAVADAGCDIITVHGEANRHLDRSLQAIRDLGEKADVSLNLLPRRMLLNMCLTGWT